MIVGFENYKSKYNFSVSGIIHVGAHIGQEYDEYIENFGEIETHWFEPINHVFRDLQNNLSEKSKTTLYNCALGSKKYKTKMYVDSGNAGQSSSILKPKLHTEQFPHILFEENPQTEIEVEKLDDFNISGCNMLVLDTQGFELEVLKGSTNTLNKIDYLFTEFNTVEMYEGCPGLDDLDKFLSDFDFYRAETWYTDFNWGDALYVKRKVEDISSIEKSIVIIDCFVSNGLVESKLLDQIKRIKSMNLDILLISNTKITKNEILSDVDYYIYDKRNQLFEMQYSNISGIDFTDYVYILDEYQFTLHKISPGLQRHGLSVLVNLFNAANFVKSLGYENFWRIEVDDLFGQESLNFLVKSPELIKSENKKALIYYNSDNISFHYMFWNVDYFLEKIPQIRNEKDYVSILLKYFDSLDFVIAEEYIYNFLKINGDSDVMSKDGSRMYEDFTDTIWNTNASLSNIDSKFENCWTSLFNMKDRNGLFLFSKNLSDDTKTRKILVYYKEKTEEINHTLPGFNTWCWNIVEENPYKFEVYEDDRLLYTEDCDNIKNFVEFP
jgi:FkbM family methyltransferase